MSSILDFIKEYRSNCSQQHLHPILDKMIEDGVDSVEELAVIIGGITAERDSYEQFSIDYMTHWSIMTYVQDILDQINRKEHER